MTVGALLNAGLPLEYLRQELRKLALPAFEIFMTTIERSMIAATKFDVAVLQHSLSAEHDAAHHAHGHDHEPGGPGHHHHHDAQSSHASDQTPDVDLAPHIHEHGFSYGEILQIISASQLSNGVKERAQSIFHVIAEAEAVIHGVALEDVHFHEVGAVDSVVDIVATAIGLEHFGVEECRSRVVPLGAGGFVHTAHGKMPIPTPATLAILAGYPTELGATSAELTTPTGAGIVKALSAGLLDGRETLHVEAIGYGAGKKEFAEQPNLLRIVIGELETKGTEGHAFPETDTVIQLTASIDDMTPVALGYVQEKLLQSGALECYLRPIQMKKGRLASELVLLCAPTAAEEMLALLERETTTIGVRVERLQRRKAVRNLRHADHPKFGAFQYKEIGGEKPRREPEFEDAKRISLESGLPLLEVIEGLRSVLR